MNDWQTTIGLEIHVQLLTNSKIFSSSSTAYGSKPNRQASYVDVGMPGTLPVLNKSVIKKAIEFGLAINGSISKKSIFARKNYFYPDLPKNYQISQLDLPIVEGGFITIEGEKGILKKINITRAHLEEDAGKSIHSEQNNCTYIDLNRAGTPLLEIVSEPEISSAFEAVQYMKKIHSIVTFLQICDGNMQEGSFRCDANVSINKKGDKELGTRTELKNINSFKFVEKAINYEIRRQINIVEEGSKVIQETRLYDEEKDITKSMRSKEEANDYRYFPDPDLLPIEIDSDYITQIKSDLPDLPDVKEKYYRTEYNLTDEQLNIILNKPSFIKIVDEILDISKIDPIKIINYFISSLYPKINKDNFSLDENPYLPKSFCETIDAIENGLIPKHSLKKIIDEIFLNKDSVSEILQKYSSEEHDDDLIDQTISDIIENNKKQVDEYKSGKTKILGFFVGQVLKNIKGVNPSIVKDKIIKALNSV